MKKHGVMGFLMVFLFVLGLFLIAPDTFCSTVDSLSFTNLTQEVGRGVKDTWNRYEWSMEELGGKIHAGTWSVNLDIAGMITAVSGGDVDFSGTSDPLSLMYTFMECNGTLYAGPVNSDGAKIIYTRTGDKWEPLTGVPMSNSENTTIRAMIVQDCIMIVATENNKTGGELWVYDANNGSSWHKITGDFDGDPSLAELAFFNGDLYLGTRDFDDKFKLFKVSEDNTVKDVTPVLDGCNDLSNLGVMKLIEYHGRLYLGTVDNENGFNLLSTDDPLNTEGWKGITTNGFGDPSNTYSCAMKELNGNLYTGTFNDDLYSGIYDPAAIPVDGRGQLWSSTNGTNWSQVADDGFGSRFNYGIRTMTVTADNRLVVGTASNLFIPEQSTLHPSLISVLDDIDGVDAQALIAQLEGMFKCNWIGTDVLSSEPASSQAPEPANILLLGIGLACLAKFWIKSNT